MNYAAGLAALGIVVMLYILYRVTQKAFNVVFGIMCVHAYLLLVDRVYPDVSLLRIVHGSSSSCSCPNQTSPLLPITLETPITLTEISEKINEQVPSEWKSWIPSFLSTTTPSSSSPAVETQREDSKPNPKSTANTKVKDEFEEFQRWKASQKDL